MTGRGAGPLRRRLLEFGLWLADATVLSRAARIASARRPATVRVRGSPKSLIARSAARRIHLRGLHHGLLGERRPDSRLYVNDDPTWSWLAGPAKAARFLGFVPFARIIDARNSPPVINHTDEMAAGPRNPLRPPAAPTRRRPEYRHRRRWSPKARVFGEKTSVADVVLPIAKRFEADVFLAAGEISETLLFEMASAGAADGRPIGCLHAGRLRLSWQPDAGVHRP